MAQLTDDCFAFGGPLMTAAEALARLDERLGCVVGAETIPLARAAGRILAEDVAAPRAVPPHANAAVDGYAVRHADLDREGETRLPVAGRAAAGHPLAAAPGQGRAVRVFTGAALPAELDTVVMQEDCRLDGDHVVVPATVKRGANRREAGEDLEAGQVALRSGRRLRAQDIGLAAAVGRGALAVYRPVRVAVFSTGDELREPGEDLPPGAIHDANRYALAALLGDLGCAVTDIGIVPDRFEAVRDSLAQAAPDNDLVVTSGGMSVGEEDHVKAAVQSMGSLHFWQLAVKPGRPLGLGQVSGIPFMGLPGNPVAMMVTFIRFARPAILRLGGCTETAPHFFTVRAQFGYKKKAGRREWLRVRLVSDADGGLAARRFPREGSGILSSMVEADGLVELPEGLTRLEAGTPVDFLPFSEVLR